MSSKNRDCLKLTFLLIGLLHMPSSMTQTTDSKLQDQNCTTPDNVQGRCINIYKCPTLEPLLRLQKPLPQNVVTYLRSSFCQNAERYSVCCSDRPPSVTQPAMTQSAMQPSVTQPAMTQSAMQPSVTQPAMPQSAMQPSVTPSAKEFSQVPNQSIRCITPDNIQGRCVNIYECPTLEPLLRLPKPPPQNVTTYLKSSLCQGAERYSVCCSDKPPSVAQSMVLFPKCGIDWRLEDATRISGDNAKIWQYPWVGRIEYQNSTGEIFPACSGTLIAKRYVLTAAHCVKPSDNGAPFRVTFSEFNLSNPECTSVAKGCPEVPVMIPIEQSILHPGYSAGTISKNDIAVIRLAREAPYTDFIRPICLPTTDITVDLKTGKRLTLAGWAHSGPTEHAKKDFEMSFLETSTCENFIEELWDKHLCASWGYRARDPRLGDSGGPLMHFADGKYTLVGVESCGYREYEDAPDVYTRIFAYSDWINAQMRP